MNTQSPYMKAGFRSCSVFFLVHSSLFQQRKSMNWVFTSRKRPIWGSEYPKQEHNEVGRGGWKEILHDLYTVRGPAAAGKGQLHEQEAAASSPAQPSHQGTSSKLTALPGFFLLNAQTLVMGLMPQYCPLGVKKEKKEQKQKHEK